MPFLQIVEQPRKEFRFRYKTEVKATYGTLHGESSSSEKTFPTVQLCNYDGEVIIRCSLFQVDTLSPLLHPHKLITRPNGKFCIDPHILRVSNGMLAVFRGISISHTPKKEIAEVYLEKRLVSLRLELGHDLNELEKTELGKSVERDLKEINLNKVCLGFEAFTENDDGSLKRICDTVYSHEIKNLSELIIYIFRG